MDHIKEKIRYAAMYQLEKLSLSYSELKEIPEEVFELVQLKTLNLNKNDFTTISKSISKLTLLETLYLSSNDIKRLPDEIGKLKNLKTLIINGCLLESLPDSLGNLENLEFLDIRYNKLNSLPHTLGKLKKLETLLIEQNPLKELPPEIHIQSTKVLLNYLKSQQKGETIELFEAKLIIVGAGEVGKTWLKERLIFNGIKSNNINNTTEGIDISKWLLDTELSKDFRVNIWDFGGQEIYHSTHHFFLTERSLYLLVFDARKDYDVSSFGYWLNTIQLLSDNAPIIIVLNKIDERIKNIDVEGLKEQFPNIKDYSKISALKGDGRHDLIKIIQDNIINLEHVGQKLPITWVEVRNQLEKLNVNFISYGKYIDICRQNDIDEQLARDLSKYYHILGVFLHFPDNMILKGVIFLNPTWATTAVYKILDDKTVQINNGKFSYEQLPKIWDLGSGYPDEYHIHLLELMKKFELCFQLPKENWFIVPELLPSTKPTLDWNFENNLVFELKYTFMPAGIMTRFIVRAHELIKENLYWKSGVVLEELTYLKSNSEHEPLKELTTRSLIIANEFEKNIIIYIDGDEKREFLFYIRRQLASIHETLRNPTVTEIITCCCDQCSKDQFPEKIEFNKIRQYRNNNTETFPCAKSGIQVHVLKLLGDFELTDQNLKEEILNEFKRISNETDSDESFIEKVNKTLIMQPNLGGFGLDLNKMIEIHLAKRKNKNR